MKVSSSIRQSLFRVSRRCQIRYLNTAQVLLICWHVSTSGSCWYKRQVVLALTIITLHYLLYMHVSSRISTVLRWLERNHSDVKRLWADIDDVIIKTLISAHSTLRQNYRSCFLNHDQITACFDILGFDILLDQKLKPHLLEVSWRTVLAVGFWRSVVSVVYYYDYYCVWLLFNFRKAKRFNKTLLSEFQ